MNFLILPVSRALILCQTLDACLYHMNWNLLTDKMNFKVITTITVIILLSVSCQSQSKEILCLFGIGTETAEKWNGVLLRELATKGHALTVVTPTKWNFENEINVDVIHLEKGKAFLKKLDENKSNNLEQNIWTFIINWYNQHMATCQGNMESIGLSEALHLAFQRKRNFELILYDLTYGPGCLLYLAYLFGNIPIVGITSSTLSANMLQINQQSSLSPALDPYVLSDFSRELNFWKRLYNTVLYGFDSFYRQWVVRPVVESLWFHNRHTKNVDVPQSLDTLLDRFKIILVNHHPALHTITSLPVNVISVPGLHIGDKPSTKFTSNLSKFIANSKLGIILIDLSLNPLSDNNLNTILEAIRKFPRYGFIWNVDNSQRLLKNQPLNLFLDNNIINEDILRHNKLKSVLITPEILRVQECLYHGVPIVTITLRAEERYLGKRIEEQGFGINIQLNNLETITLATSLERSLSDKNMTSIVKQLQQSLKYQQNRPLDTAVWWIENVIENPHATDHLRMEHVNSLGFFARNSFDVLLLFEVLILICIINFVLTCRQTIQNFKEMFKAKKNSAVHSNDILKKVKRERKENRERKEKREKKEKKEKKEKNNKAKSA